MDIANLRVSTTADTSALEAGLKRAEVECCRLAAEIRRVQAQIDARKEQKIRVAQVRWTTPGDPTPLDRAIQQMKQGRP